MSVTQLDEQRQFRDEGSMAPQYADQGKVGYFPVYQPMDSVNAYSSVQANQMAYLSGLATRANHHSTYQIVPKVTSHRVPTDSVDVHFTLSSVNVNEVSRPFQTLGLINIWHESVYINKKRGRVKIDMGARVNVMSIKHLRALGFSKQDLRFSNIVLVAFNQALIRPLGSTMC